MRPEATPDRTSRGGGFHGSHNIGMLGISGARSSTVNAAILATLIIAALYFGKIVFLPFAAAILIAFILAPIVKALRTVRVPRAAAVIAVVLATFAALISLGVTLTSQARNLVSELPRYEATLRAKARTLRGVTTSGPALERATQTLKELKEELEGDGTAAADAPSSSASTPAQRRKLDRLVDRIAPGTATAQLNGESNAEQQGGAQPIPVEIHYPRPKPFENLIAWVTPIIEPVAMLAIVVVLVLFILMQKEELRDRFIRLSGATDMQRTTAAMTDAGQRLSRFLLTLTLLNIGYGVFIAAAMWWLEIPAPLLWGIVAALMRFVPFFGSVVAAAFPVILAAAVDPGWNTFLLTLGLFVVGEGLMGQVIEPLVQGRSTGLSPLAILVSAAFWTLLWGPVGLLLAVPMTLCLVVLGQHVDGLKFLHILLGDEPAFSPGERFYQRTLAGDANEITEMAEQQLKQAPLCAYYRDVALEGLRLAQIDAENGLIEEDHMERISDTVEMMVDNLWDVSELSRARTTERKDADEGSSDGSDEDHETTHVPVLEPDDRAPGWQAEGAVILVPANSKIDEAAAHILTHLICRHGVDAEVASDSISLFREQADKTSQARLICICSMSANLAQSRYLARRIARRFPKARIVVVIWGGGHQDTCAAFAKSEEKSIALVTNSLQGALVDIIAEASRRDLPGKIDVDTSDDVDFAGRPSGQAA